MYGILDRYVGKNVVLSILLVSVCLTLFAALIQLIDALRYIGRGYIDFLFVLKYVGLKLPSIYVTFFPISILIGCVVGLGMMARNSEIIILQSIGLSKLNIGLSCVKTVLPLMLIVVLIGETLAPHYDKKSESEFDRMSNTVGITVTNAGAWVKENNNFYGIAAIINGKNMAGVVRYEFNDDGQLISFRKAMSGELVDGKWKMKNVSVQKIEDNEVKFYRTQYETWPLNVTEKRLIILCALSESMSVIQLYDYIKYIETNGVDSSRYRLSFYSKIFSPLVMLVMMLLALSTIFGPLRSMNMGARILAGITLGFGYYVLNQIVAPFSLVYGVPPFIGAIFATVVFAVFAVYLLRRKS